MNPLVSFVVPCYKLAHLLPECVNSILGQTFRDFEILIMDDCSPDNTAEVAQSFKDERVKHIRNAPNLGHLRNYNKGISMARGKYVWLISADDRLRSQDVLRRYIELMENNDNVGFVFCPAIGVRDGKEDGLLKWTTCGKRSRIWPGRELLGKLVFRNCIAAASGLVRKECYEKLGAFPLDLPYAGDWYMWCIFTLFYDAAYFAEPMIDYRLHELSMTSLLARRRRMDDIIAVPWRIRREALKAGESVVANRCLEAIAQHYGFCATAARFQASDYNLPLDECENSMRERATSSEELRSVRALFLTSFGDGCYGHGDRGQALKSYRRALAEGGWQPSVFMKYVLVRMGVVGDFLRQQVSKIQRDPMYIGEPSSGV